MQRLNILQIIPARSQSAAFQKASRTATENRMRLGFRTNFGAVQAQGHNIRRYSDYLITRAKAFADTKIDHVRSGQGRLKRLTVDKGLLRETEVVQRQIKALLKCDVCLFFAEQYNRIVR